MRKRGEREYTKEVEGVCERKNKGMRKRDRKKERKRTGRGNT